VIGGFFEYLCILGSGELGVGSEKNALDKREV